jgi:hypothetical protein
MIDTKLIADALKKSAGQLHLAVNHGTCYQGNMTRYQLNRNDLTAKSEAEFHERVLRSFLVTGCFRTSEKLVQKSVAIDINAKHGIH